MIDLPSVGPTGEPPIDSGDPHDRGGLNAAVWVNRPHKLIEVRFGTSITFLKMTPDEARTFGAALYQAAIELER